MKKFLITTCGAIFVVLLLVSSATAVPKVNSDPLMDIITDVEKTKQLLEDNISTKTLNVKTRESVNLLVNKIKDTLYTIAPNPKLGGIIDLLIKIIQWLINFVQQLISVISAIYNIVQLIYTLITLLTSLYNLILQLIEFIQNIFNPQPSACT